MMKARAGIAGHMAANVYDGHGKCVRRRDFHNIILTGGLDQVGQGSMNLLAAKLGAGTSTPVVSDTALTEPIGTLARTSVSYSARQSEPYYGITTARYEQSLTDSEATYSEVAIATSSLSALFSRALVRDQDGNPVGIQVLAGEVAEVVYELALIPPTADVVFQLTDSGDTYDCIMRAADVTDPDQWALLLDSLAGVDQQTSTITCYTGALAAVTGHPTGEIGTYGVTADEYVLDSNQLVLSARLGPGEGNHASGIQCVRFSTPVGAYQVSFDPPIPKTVDNFIVFDFTVEWGNDS